MERKFRLMIFGFLVFALVPNFVTMDAYAITPDVRALDSSTNRIIQIDPTTGMILGGFATPDPGIELISGLTFAEGGSTLLFQNDSPLGNPANLYRLNPSNGAVLNTHSMIPAPSNQRGGLSFETGAGVAGVDAIFAIMNGFGVDRQDGYNGPVSTHFGPAPFFPGALGGDDAGRHFVYSNNRIEEFNPLVPNAPPINSFPSPGSLTGLAFEGTNLYATDGTNLWTLNPNNGAIISVVQVTGVSLTGLAARQAPITVGGSDVSINTSALLLAGVQSISMWMIPVVIAGAGIGLFVIKRRN